MKKLLCLFSLFLVLSFTLTGCKGFFDVINTGSYTVTLVNDLPGKVITEITLESVDEFSWNKYQESLDLMRGEKYTFYGVAGGDYTVKFVARDANYPAGDEKAYISKDNLNLGASTEVVYEIKNVQEDNKLAKIKITNETGYTLKEIHYTVDDKDWENAKKETLAIEDGLTRVKYLPEGEYYLKFYYSVSQSQTEATTEYEGDCLLMLSKKIKIEAGEEYNLTVNPPAGTLF